MAIREIIHINEELCNGCGNCISACAEGALQMVNGKAKLVKEQYCDGFGDCIGECPTGALNIEKKESDEFDFTAVKEHVSRQGGQEAVAKLEQADRIHKLKQNKAILSTPTASGGGCPGKAMRFNQSKTTGSTPVEGAGGQAIVSELNQWPVQIHLVQPGAPFFKNRELIVLSTCSPIASADIHWRFIRGRAVVVGCPKLDRTEGYVEKLAGILAEPSIPAVITVRMEVPCCGGLSSIVHQAAEKSGRSDIQVKDVIVSLNGDIMT